MVSQRRKQLDYLKSRNEDKYKEINSEFYLENKSKNFN